MGLCRCPRRRVTTLFCFEHRVNVCESCLVSGHPRCVVQSYLRWLQDSDYSPECRLCGTPLSSGDTVRLVCYDVFHWGCLAGRARALPPRTAPGGFRCPACGGPLFPPPNLQGPLAAALRRRLRPEPWARDGLGLPMLDAPEPPLDLEPEPDPGAATGTWGDFQAPPEEPSPSPSPPQGGLRGGGESPPWLSSAPRKGHGGRESREPPPDREEDKYRRRRRWWRWRRPPPRALALGGALALLLLLLLLGGGLGPAAPPGDPALDPLRPPHVRVGQ